MIIEHVEDSRVGVACSASYEIEVIVQMLQRERSEFPEFEFDILLSSMLRRISSLNSVIMSVVSGDDDRDTEEMQQVVHG